MTMSDATQSEARTSERRPLSATSPFFHEERHASLAAAADRLITVCGVGALGGNLAETLARMGFRYLSRCW